MFPADDRTPEERVAHFFSSFTEGVVRGDDPAAAVDRWYTPDIVQISDGIRIDREKLIAHLRPVRKNFVAGRYEVHEALVCGDRLAARLTIHAELRNGRTIVTEVHLFGELAPDGRMRRTHQLTRTVSDVARGAA